MKAPTAGQALAETSEGAASVRLDQPVGTEGEDRDKCRDTREASSEGQAKSVCMQPHPTIRRKRRRQQGAGRATVQAAPCKRGKKGGGRVIDGPVEDESPILVST